ncbi:MAG: aminotransferase class III-fold pyridoxal phosphate-dependent enzyme, partial [Gemmatimonadota bacterium]|nr:aminotransferase class III-fold pyridoxal phosphate-dependent enzyme [Gemmatimonadota bacterium]
MNSPVRSFRSVGGEPFFVDRGEGAHLYDTRGRRYVDYVLSWGPLILGHAHPVVTEALGKQLDRGTSYGAPTEAEVELAERIVRLVPTVEM